MSSPPARFSQLQWLHKLICVASMVGGIALIFLGCLNFGESANLWMVAGGFLLLFLALVQMTVMPLLAKMESTMARQLDELRDIHARLEYQGRRLDSISENTRISDAAKALAHREQEIEAIRAIIHEDVRLEKWDAALKLVDDMEHRFGFKEEAEALREELDEARAEAIQDRLSQAIRKIEKHFAAHDWTMANKEIDRLTHALPDNVKVSSLRERMKVLQEQHKQELLQRWDAAVKRSDVDTAIDILKELDQYLSPAEATRLQDSARDVFKEKLLQLGVQFRFAVTEKRWNDALHIGLELVREFPNARMAKEVRDVLDTLRERARQAGAQVPAEEPTSTT